MDTWLKILLVIVGVLVLAVAVYFIYKWIKRNEKDGLFRLPFQLLGLRDLPAVPFSFKDTIEAGVRLIGRSLETKQALNGLQNVYQIGANKATGLAYLFGLKESTDHKEAKESVIKELEEAVERDFKEEGKLKDRASKKELLASPSDMEPITQLSLSSPEQYAMGWTAFAGVYEQSKERLTDFALALEVSAAGVEVANQLFWKNIAEFGTPFNLILPKKISPTEYEIDMTIFRGIQPSQEENTAFWRFTPATLIHLRQDPVSKELIPYSIEVSNYQGAQSQTYYYEDSSNNSGLGGWMYALQAAKASVTVWGIWLGHVYHWHIVTAALQMTMVQNLEASHPVRVLFDPMSKFLIGFDAFLLLTFKYLAPPTSVANGLGWMELENLFAAGRTFHEDDPKETLARLGISPADFTKNPGQDWDTYPTVRYLLDIWNATEEYVTNYVDLVPEWATGKGIVKDKPLHKWLKVSGDQRNGNVQGLPTLLDAKTAKAELIQLLTSYLYRITAHGSSRMNAAANPGLAFVGNFPPTLQIKDLPDPGVSLTTEQLLKYLPKTGTIGSMITFLFTFIFSAPYESFIPAKGIDQDLFFSGDKDTPMNKNLIDFRKALEKVIIPYEGESAVFAQWPRNIET